MPHLAVIYLIVTWILLSLAPSSAVTLPVLSSSILEIEEEEESSLTEQQSASTPKEASTSDKKGAQSLITVKHLNDMPSIAAADKRAAALSAAYSKAMEQKEERPSPQQHEFLRSLELKHDESVLGEGAFLPDNQAPLSQANSTDLHTNFELVTTVHASEMEQAALHQASKRDFAVPNNGLKAASGAGHQATPSAGLKATPNVKPHVSSPYIYGRTEELSPETIALALELLKLEPLTNLNVRLSFMSNDTIFVLNEDDLQSTIVDCLQGHAYDCYIAGRHYDAMVSAELKQRLKAAPNTLAPASSARSAEVSSTSVSEANGASLADINGASTAEANSANTADISSVNATEASELSAFKDQLQEQNMPESAWHKHEQSTRQSAEPSTEPGNEDPEASSPEVLVANSENDVVNELPPVVNNIMHMLSFYRRGCIEGSKEGCTMLANANGRIGVALILGLFELKYPEIAVQYLERGCQRGDPGACANLGLVQFNGLLGTRVTLKASFSKLRESCKLALTSNRLVRDYDNNVSLGCLSLGTLALHGVNKDGVTLKPNVHAARRDLNLACNLYSMEGCEMLHKLDDSLERAAFINVRH